MRLTMTAAISARWGHRVDGLIHTHAWTVQATVEGPAHAAWKGYQPLLVEREATVEEIVRMLWDIIEADVPGLVDLALVEAYEFDRCRTVRLSRD